MKENVLAFISGSTAGLFAGVSQRLVDTVILAFVGGIVGIMGKDIYEFIKGKLKAKFKK